MEMNMEKNANRRTQRARQGSPYLNTSQAAHFLGIGWRKLQRLRVEGKGPRFRRHGRLIYYHIDDLETWSRGTAVGGGGDD